MKDTKGTTGIKPESLVYFMPFAVIKSDVTRFLIAGGSNRI